MFVTIHFSNSVKLPPWGCVRLGHSWVPSWLMLNWITGLLWWITGLLRIALILPLLLLLQLLALVIHRWLTLLLLPLTLLIWIVHWLLELILCWWLMHNYCLLLWGWSFFAVTAFLAQKATAKA